MFMLIARLPAVRVLLALGLAGILAFPIRAAEKVGMPDLAQEEETCLPTSTANLIVWFGLHGYPKLIAQGDSADDDFIHTVHAIITYTKARYDLGTEPDTITAGISKYIHDAGYGCDVEYRGLDSTMTKQQQDASADAVPTTAAFSQDWLQENDKPNKGFILLLTYVSFDQNSNSYQNAYSAGHAVTLVNAEPDMILIHDPAHYSDEPGRKILTPEVLTGGTFHEDGANASVAGLLLLSGSLLEAPPDAGVLMTGAVCVTMHPASESSKVIGAAAGAPNGMIAGKTGLGSAPTSPTSTGAAPSTSWAAWLFNLIFSK